MRTIIVLTSTVALAACGGGMGAQTAGSLPVTGSATGAATSGVTQGGNGSGLTAATGTTPAANTTPTSFLAVTTAKTFNALGSIQQLTRTASGSVYSGNAATVRSPSGTIDYDPRDGIFTLKVADTKANVSNSERFQDPAHRTDFSGTYMPSGGTPNLTGFNYLEDLQANGQNTLTFFYQRPGTSAYYVSLAGYVRNPVDDNAATRTYERGVFVFGDPTVQTQIPVSGTATYTGGFLASMVNNPTYDSSPQPTSFQWISGNSTVGVDFGRATFNLTVTGVVGAPNLGNLTPQPLSVIAAGSTFSAVGSGTLDIVRTGGFTGVFSSASFNNGAQVVDFRSVNAGSSVAGASSIDGQFFGPNAVNLGGNMRIIGGTPDQRVDILGAFTGAKTGN